MSAEIFLEIGTEEIPSDYLENGLNELKGLAEACLKENRIMMTGEFYVYGTPRRLILAGKGIGILLTDHNVRETLSITNHSYIIDAGSVIADGTPFDLVVNELVRKTYLGEKFRL